MDARLNLFMRHTGFNTIEDKVPEIHEFCELENMAVPGTAVDKRLLCGAKKTQEKQNELLRVVAEQNHERMQ